MILNTLEWKQFIADPPSAEDLNWQGAFLLAFNVGTPEEAWAIGDAPDLGKGRYVQPSTYWAKIP